MMALQRVQQRILIFQSTGLKPDSNTIPIRSEKVKSKKINKEF